MPRLAADEIEVTSFALDDEALLPLDLAFQWLDEAERERAASFHFDEHRERYIRGRAMLRKLLSRHVGTSPSGLRFRVGERGKPDLPGAGVHFNLSHSNDRAAVAISRLPSVGIDIECFDRKVDVEGLSRRCFRPSECERLARLAGDERTRGFFWTWTAKEARMKATGEGFGLEPQRIEIAFSGALPRLCLEPRSPPAYVAPVRMPGVEVACTVASLSRFAVSLTDAAADLG